MKLACSITIARPAADIFAFVAGPDYRLVGWGPPQQIEWHADDGHDRITITYRLHAADPDHNSVLPARRP